MYNFDQKTKTKQDIYSHFMSLPIIISNILTLYCIMIFLATIHNTLLYLGLGNILVI